MDKPLSSCAALDGAQRLPHRFYDRDTVQVAQDLLGMLLVHRVDGQLRAGRIVETEAYLGGHDLASHSSKGVTPRTQTMFGPPGYAYVYLIYGMYHCMNVVTEPQGHGCAVLIRALEPVCGIDRRTSGPGLLCKAMDIDRRLNGADLCSDDFYIAQPAQSMQPVQPVQPMQQPPFTIVARPRIGVDYAGEWAAKPLRFYIEGSTSVSRK